MRQDEDHFDGSLGIENEILQGLEPLIVNEDQKSEPGVRRSMQRVRRAVELALRETNDVTMTQNIVREALKGNLTGAGGTVNISENIPKDVTPKSKALSVVSSSKQELSIDLSMVSNGPIEILERDASQSNDLMTSTAKGLQNLLRGLTEKYEKGDLVPDAQTVQAAASVAKQMSNMMRLKLDTLKFQKEVFHMRKNFERLKTRGGGKTK